MKQVVIVGVGMGPDTLTRQGVRAIEEAEVLFGAPRMLEMFSYLGKTAYPQYASDEVAKKINESDWERVAVLVSGDTGFYSAAEQLISALPGCETLLIPGVSSLSSFFSKLKRPWQGVKLLSCHGRYGNIVDAVRRNCMTFVLTGNNIAALLSRLADAGFGGLTAYAGENLGQNDEHVLIRSVEELGEEKLSSLCVLAVENPRYDARIRFGIPDTEFVRGDAPMTKRETRAMALSLLGLAPDAVCCDIGAGTGSVTVEMALAAHEGWVYAIEREGAAAQLITQNCRAFHIGNVSVLPGSAPDRLAELPRLDAAFIGGSGGRMKEIIAGLLHNNPHMRIVVSAIALESVSAALDAFSQSGNAPELLQLSAARAKTVGDLHMMLSQNPVFLIAGGGGNA